MTELLDLDACPSALDADGWSGRANLDASRSATARLRSLMARGPSSSLGFRRRVFVITK
jgi:hypothetical protein